MQASDVRRRLTKYYVRGASTGGEHKLRPFDLMTHKYVGSNRPSTFGENVLSVISTAEQPETLIFFTRLSWMK